MTMRLATLSQFKAQSTQLSDQFSRLATLQVQVSSGKKIQQSSDDPRLAAQMTSVQDSLDRLNSYDNNLVLAQNRATLTSSVLQQASNLGIRAQGLLTQAQNPTLSNSDRSALAIELSSILDSMVGIANTQDGNGTYLFNGVASGPAYAKNGVAYEYQGTYVGNSIAIGDNSQIQYSQSGFSVFGDIKSGTGLFSIAANVNNMGTGYITPVTTSNTGVITDHYTLTMVTNAAGQLAYQVFDDTTGQLVAPVAPADSPEYVSGSMISFNGVTTQIEGEPLLGDSFTISPSTTQNIFSTLQNAINALNTPITTPQSRAAVNQIMLEQSSSFNGAFNHLVDEVTKSGLRAQHIDMQMNFNKETIIQQKTYLSALSDVDLPEAISKLSLQMTMLEMSQQTYSKLQEMFKQLMSQQF